MFNNILSTSVNTRLCAQHCSSGCTALPAPPCAHKPGSSESAHFGFFIVALLHRQEWLNHWLLVTDPTSSPSPLPEVRGWNRKSKTSNDRVDSPGNQPHPELISKSHLIKKFIPFNTLKILSVLEAVRQKL